MSTLTNDECPKCGAPLERLADGYYRCPYCGATMTAPAPASTDEDAPGPPLFVKVAVAATDIKECLARWLDAGSFADRGAKETLAVTDVDGAYIPIYLIAGTARSTWTGQYSTTHYRTVSRPAFDGRRWTTAARSEKYRNWHVTSGDHADDYTLFLPGTSDAVYTSLAEVLGDTSPLVKPDDVVGPIEGGFKQYPFTVDAAAAAALFAEKSKQYEKEACGRLVEALTAVHTDVEQRWWKRYYYPCWFVAYSARGRKFRARINGFTGTVAGEKPKSKWKIAASILVPLFIILSCIGLVLLHPRFAGCNPKPAPYTETAPVSYEYATVTVDWGLPLRTGPRADAPQVSGRSELEKGERLKVLARDGEWLNVETADGYTGWVRASLRGDVFVRTEP